MDCLAGTVEVGRRIERFQKFKPICTNKGMRGRESMAFTRCCLAWWSSVDSGCANLHLVDEI